MSRDRRQPPLAACEELAQLLATEEGLRTLRLLQQTGMVGVPRAVEPAGLDEPYSDEDDPDADRPEAIGIWEPQEVDGELVFVRPDPLELEDDWALTKTLRPKDAFLPIRVCLVGESTAAGFLYAPDLTPAQVLQGQLDATAGADLFEVIDLCRVDQTDEGVLEVSRTALQLLPDVIVVFAGNNWLAAAPDAPAFADVLSLELLHEHAAALDAEGPAGLQRLATNHLKSKAEAVCAELAAIADRSGVTMALVVPETNLTDWEHDLPPSWLPGDRNRRWLAHKQEVLDALANDDLAAAENAARAMLALDDGTCATSHQALGTTLLRIGRTEAARDALLAGLEASRWLGRASAPGASPVVRQAIRDAAQAHDLLCVDLPAVFADHAASPLPGRRLFLDYCHLTPEGMHVAMAAVVAEVLAVSHPARFQALDWRTVASASPPPSPADTVEARGAMLAALHTAHIQRPLTDGAAGTEYWIEQALDSSEGIEEVLADYVAAKAACAPPLLSSAQQRVFESPYRMPARIWRWQDYDVLDVPVVRAVIAVLERRRPGAGERLELLLADARGLERGEQDLARGYFRGSPFAAYPTSRSYERALTPESTFHFLVVEPRAVELALTLRAPRDDEDDRTSALVLNGTEVGRITTGAQWSRATVLAPATTVRSGINTLRLRWPELDADGGPHLERAVRRLQLGLAPDLRPVFGEIHTLRARMP